MQYGLNIKYTVIKVEETNLLMVFKTNVGHFVLQMHKITPLWPLLSSNNLTNKSVTIQMIV